MYQSTSILPKMELALNSTAPLFLKTCGTSTYEFLHSVLRSMQGIGGDS